MRQHSMKRTAVALLLSLALASVDLAEPAGGLGTPFTIPGTASWKVGAQKTTGMTKTTDFWWDHVTSTERYLVPQNGASAAVMETSFDKVTAEQARAASLSQGRIPGAQLRPGRVVIFKTAAGRRGKFEVVGYTPLNGARGGDIAEYDLQVRWMFF